MTEIHTTTVAIAKWAVEADIDIEAWIEPQGQFEFNDSISGIEDDSMEDSSSFYGESVSLSGSISFVVSAVDEDTAREIADEALDSVYFSNYYNDLDWEIKNAEITSLEKMREPMTLSLAREYLRDFLSSGYNRQLTTEVLDAIKFVLEYLEKLDAIHKVQEEEDKQNG